jgi:glycosyltransferase involved in cell wall biosynthesis
MKPLVSILIPAFNSERWVGEAIESALGQTWPTKEIFVVDDGSTDQTLSVARQFASASVSIITQSNQGAACARNKAYSLSQGDYIQWLDADDVLASDKVSKQMEVLLRDDTRRTLVSSAFGQFRHTAASAIFSPTSLWCDLLPVEWLIKKLEDNVFMQTATWLVSRELTEAAGPWDTRLSVDDDGEYFCRVIRESNGICFVPEARVFYRRRVDSLSYIGESTLGLESQFLSIQKHISHLRSLEKSERTRQACLKFLRTYAVCFYPERLDLFKTLQDLAVTLDGYLEIPRLPWKYAGIQKAFGWTAAKRAQLCYNQAKSSVLSFWDAALFRLKL